MAKKFALKTRGDGFIRCLHYHPGEGHGYRVVPVCEATRYLTLKGAVIAATRYGRWSQSVDDLTIVGVEEIPGETKRELVPLEGVVDFDELSGFVERSLITGYFRGPYTMSPKKHLKDVTPYPTLSSWVGAAEYELYGVREVSKPPMLRIISLEDALEAYDG